MKAEFFGVRGSIPRPLSPAELIDRIADRSKGEDLVSLKQLKRWAKDGTLGYGSNTSCVSLEAEGQRVIIDGGTGIRDLGRRLIPSQEPIHILLTHLHWDHIQGFPFFVPFYLPGREIHIHSPVDTAAVEEALKRQWSRPYFPVEFADLPSKIQFHSFTRSTKFGPFSVKACRLAHPDPTFGFRVEAEAKAYVHFSDVEMRGISARELKTYRAFLKGADLLVADTQFDHEEIETFQTWGHSCAETFLELFRDCDIKTLAMFHYNPQEAESKIDQLIKDAKKKRKALGMSTRIVPAVEGTVIKL